MKHYFDFSNCKFTRSFLISAIWWGSPCQRSSDDANTDWVHCLSPRCRVKWQTVLPAISSQRRRDVECATTTVAMGANVVTMSPDVALLAGTGHMRIACVQAASPNNIIFTVGSQACSGLPQPKASTNWLKSTIWCTILPRINWLSYSRAWAVCGCRSHFATVTENRVVTWYCSDCTVSKEMHCVAHNLTGVWRITFLPLRQFLTAGLRQLFCLIHRLHCTTVHSMWPLLLKC